MSHSFTWFVEQVWKARGYTVTIFFPSLHVSITEVASSMAMAMAGPLCFHPMTLNVKTYSL